MTLVEIDALFRRLQRITDAVREKEGAGFEYQVTLDDGSVHTYRVERMRSLDTLEDDTANLCLWIWNAKDYLKKRARALGQNTKSVEEAVNASTELSLCADLANGLKHGGPRSDTHPRLGRASYTMPHGSIGSIKFEAFKVTVEPHDLEAVYVDVPVVDAQGQVVEDALELFAQAITRWEEVKADIENTVKEANRGTS